MIFSLNRKNSFISVIQDIQYSDLSYICHHSHMQSSELQHAAGFFGYVTNQLVQIEAKWRQTWEKHHNVSLRVFIWKKRKNFLILHLRLRKLPFVDKVLCRTFLESAWRYLTFGTIGSVDHVLRVHKGKSSIWNGWYAVAVFLIDVY